MSFGIALSVEAEHDLARMPVLVRQQALRHLEALADYPAALSRPSHFPFREKCQISPVDFDHEGTRWELFCLFQYAQDEKTFFILKVGVSKMTIEEADQRDATD